MKKSFRDRGSGFVVVAILVLQIILKIIDGDTIVLNNEKIRFSGIDTPELKQTCVKNGQKSILRHVCKDASD